LKTTAAESYRLLGEAYDELHRKKRMNDSFSVTKLEISMLQTTRKTAQKVRRQELQALLDEDDSQT